MAAMWLICVSLTALSVVAFEGERSSDLVFCPLQNQWVKRSDPPKPKFSLAAICAGSKTKDRFLEKLAERSDVAVSDADSLENLFFGFQSKGEQAFAEMPSSPNSPERQIAAIETFQTGTATNRTIVAAAVANKFTLAQFSRPPTREVRSNFASLHSRELNAFSVSVAPRGPPVSL